MKIKSKKYIKKRHNKSNKNTFKYRKNRKSRKRKLFRNKSKKMKGGGATSEPEKPKGLGLIEGELTKAKGMAMNPAPLKALPSPMGGLSKIASSAGDSLKKMVPTNKELSQVLPKTPTSAKDVGLSALSMAAKPVVIPWRLTKSILRSIRNVITATLVVPTLSMNQIVPPSLCKYYLKNDRICAQTISEYIFKGSRPDFSKRKLKDEEKCIELNPETNKYEQCKPEKMKGGGKKELIITCKGNVHHGLYKNDRVMVYIEVPPGEDPIVANKIGKNTYIGKVLSISGDHNEIFEIELENSEEEPIKVKYNKDDPNIMKYDKNVQTFISEFEKYFKDMYKNDIKWSKESNKNLDKFLICSLYTILVVVGAPTLIGLAAALGISLTAVSYGIGVAGVATGSALIISSPVLAVSGVLLYVCYQIYIKIAKMSPSRKAIYLATMKRLIDDDKVKSEKKNLYILNQLVKINHHLRLYECPKDVLESIFEMIRDVNLLKKIKNIVEQFLKGENNDHDKTQKRCDKEYDDLTKGEINPSSKLLTKFELKPNVQYVHIQNHLFNYFRPLYIDPEEENKKEVCNDVNRLDPSKIIDSFDKTIRGDTDNIAHIVINIFKGISSSDGEIYDNTKEILKNIQCRTGLIDIIDTQITKLENKKAARLAKLEEEKAKLKAEKKKLEEEKN